MFYKSTYHKYKCHNTQISGIIKSYSSLVNTSYILDIGAYGEVFKARCRKTARIVAIKRIRIEAQTLGIPTTTLREIGLLKELSNNPNVVRYISGDIKVYRSCG